MKNLNSGGTKSGKIPFINNHFYAEPQTVRINNNLLVIRLSLIEYEFLIKSFDFPGDYDLKIIQQMVLDNTKVIKRKPTIITHERL